MSQTIVWLNLDEYSNILWMFIKTLKSVLLEDMQFLLITPCRASRSYGRSQILDHAPTCITNIIYEGNKVNVFCSKRIKSILFFIMCLSNDMINVDYISILLYIFNFLPNHISLSNSNKSYPFYVYTMCYDLCNLYEIKKKKKKQNLFKEEKSCFLVGCTQ